jgi:hypothetical protein
VSTTTKDLRTSISGVMIPNSKLAREVTELVHDTESPLLFNHSTLVYYFARSQKGPLTRLKLWDYRSDG